MIDPNFPKFHYITYSKTSWMVRFIEIIGWKYLNPDPFNFKPFSKDISLRNSPCITPEFQRAAFRDQGNWVRTSYFSNIFRAAVVKVLMSDKEDICLVIKRRFFIDLKRININFDILPFKKKTSVS